MLAPPGYAGGHDFFFMVSQKNLISSPPYSPSPQPSPFPAKDGIYDKGEGCVEKNLVYPVILSKDF